MDPIFERLYPQLIRWCQRHVSPSLGDPEDFVHQVYLRCRKRWNATRASTRSTEFFYRALRWEVIDRLRARQRQMAAYQQTPRLPTTNPLAELIAHEALASLPESERRACLELLAGKSVRQIREEMGLSPMALSVRLSRAHRKLRSLLGDQPKTRESRSVTPGELN